jgi:hypothetical protein
MSVQNNYDLLIAKLDAFIRKYYVNQVIRGVLLSIGIVLAAFTITTVLEHLVFNNLQPSAAVAPRKLLFFGFLGLSLAAIGAWIMVPLVHYFRLGKTISHEKAAQIVGEHFQQVKDKLLNVLHLKRQSLSMADASLIFASINQKTEELKPVPFTQAIDLSKNKRHLRLVLPPIFLLLGLLVFVPGLIPGSAYRLVNNGQEYEPAAPFAFVPVQTAPQVPQFEDYVLEVRIEGSEMPAEAFVVVDNYSYKLTKKEGNVYTYTFSKVAKDTEFRFRGGGVESKAYTLDVIEKPHIAHFSVRLDYPAYTGRKDEAMENIGDLIVPAGTQVSWTFNAQHTDLLALRFSDGTAQAVRADDEEFTFRRAIKVDELYKILVSNQRLPKPDSVAYTITVVPDQYPTITLQVFEDSTDQRTKFFAGEVSDDYGLRNLSFQYTIERKGKTAEPVVLPLRVSGRESGYEHVFNTRDIDLQPGDKVTYFFEVWDNDGVNGSKSARSQQFVLDIPSSEQLAMNEQKNNAEIKEKLEKLARESDALRQEARKLQEQLYQKKEPDWQDRKKLEKLIDKQKNIEQQYQETIQNFQENLQNQEEFQKPDEQLKQKQEQLEKLFNEVMDEETKKLLEEMEKLLQELNKEEMLENLKNMQLTEEELNNEFDRMLELFKQLEFEKDMRDAIDQLDSLAKQQEELAKETEEGKQPQEELEKRQDEINKKFEDVRKKLDEAAEKNEELEQPNDMENTDQQEEAIEKELDQSQQELQKNQKNNAAKKQKSASQKMKDLSNQLNTQMQSMQMQQMQEDMKALRQLLENLVVLSYDQENLMDRFLKIDPSTPGYVAMVQQQSKIKEDFRIVEDSLNALGKRVMQLQSFVTEKVTDIKKNLDQSLTNFEDRAIQQATVNQQYIMTGFNDLALMLSEALQQMQSSAAQQMEGTQMCQNPGGGKPKKGQKGKKGMGEMQKGLNEQMQKMQEGMKNGKTPNGMGKEFAQMAAKQAAIRRALQELQKEKQSRGKGDKGLQDLIDQMDKTETELVNKQLNNETMRRQQDILTRLLESEKAEREREQDEQRQAETAKDKDPKMPPAMEEYIRKRQQQVEMFKTVSPSLKQYYKDLVEEYYNSLK